LGWRPSETFESGIRKTVSWYLEHSDWVQNIVSGEYEKWVRLQYPEPVAKV
jgi:dTDP-glucose 4,6-dehydratase